jgi:hypothetical protein
VAIKPNPTQHYAVQSKHNHFQRCRSRQGEQEQNASCHFISQKTRVMEAGVSLVKTNQKDTVQRLVIAAVRAAQRWSWRGSTHPPHGDEQRPQGVVQPQDGTSKVAPKVVRVYRTKTCKIPLRPRPQAGIARHHPCFMGAHLLNYCRRKKEADLRPSEGIAQEMLPQ